MKKVILIGLAILVVGFVGYQWYSSKTSTQSVTAQVRTAVVQTGTLAVKISGSGTVQPVTSEDLKSKIDNNEIDELLVTVGEAVNEGDELITFTDGSDPITAPASGIVTTLTVGAGERVTNGQVVAHLTNYKNLQTVVQIDELDIPKMKNGQTVSLQVNAYPDQAYTGIVTMVAEEGVTENGVSTFDVIIHIDKPDNLKVGMSVEASILTASKENALFVPLDAIYTANDQKYVIATIASTENQSSGTEQINVKLGLANDDYVEITEGINGGETIQLPQLATGSTTTTNRQGMEQPGGGFGGEMGDAGSMKRSGGMSGK
ncbi:MAG: HlyD family efflux transporter periplasmic adaptor subunit [Bacillus sp. (in: Bacteria)]|nr:HlyD family efflux transporter periplasmic adaptor subunit [Bacillus sp. (in: firmicutes)]